MAYLQWHGGATALNFRANHDMEHPEKMSPGELVKAITMIRAGWMSSPYAIELCKRAGNLKEWSATHTRRKAVHDAAAKFGFRFV